jgi:hypothetical protein
VRADLVQELRRRRSVWIVFGSSGSLGFADKLSCFAKRRQMAASLIVMGWITEDFGVTTAGSYVGSER